MLPTHRARLAALALSFLVSPLATAQFQVENFGLATPAYSALLPTHFVYAPGNGNFTIRTLATGQVVTTGLKVDNFGVGSASTGRLPFLVKEVATDLNGDGDQLDSVLHVFDDATGAITNIGLSVYSMSFDGNLAIVATGEEFGDQNGDGDTDDTVGARVDLASGIVTSLHFSASNSVVRGNLALIVLAEIAQGGVDVNGDGFIGDANALYDDASGHLTVLPFPYFALQGANGLAFALADENALASDLNGDGDTLDQVVTRLDPATLAPTYVPIAARSFSIAGDRLLIETCEADQQGADLNGDGDVIDFVWQIYNPATGVIFNTGFAATSTTMFPALSFIYASSVDIAVIMCNEPADGAHDRNGDGDASDLVPFVVDCGNNRVTNLGTAFISGLLPQIQFSSKYVLVLDNEGGAGADKNGDGDLLDAVLVIHELSTGAVIRTPIAVQNALLLSDSVVIAGVRENSGAVAVDENGDGDVTDTVYRAIDLDTFSSVSLGLATSGSLFGQYRQARGRDFILGVNETEQGVTDLNGDGDKNDIVLHRVRLDAPACGGSLPYGAACSGSLAQAPTLGASGCAAAGGAFALSIGSGPANGAALLFVGQRSAALTVPFGCSLLVDPAFTFTSALPLSPSGFAQIGAVLPPSAAGVAAVTQAFVTTSALPGAFAATAGLEFHVVP